jgi:hypothetical protein
MDASGGDGWLHRPVSAVPRAMAPGCGRQRWPDRERAPQALDSRNRLLATSNPFPRAAAPQLAALHLVHRSPDLILRWLSHICVPGVGAAQSSCAIRVGPALSDDDDTPVRRALLAPIEAVA